MTDDAIRRVTTPAGDPPWLVPGHDDVRALLADPRLGRSHPEPERAARMSRSAIFGGPLGNDPATEDAGHARMRRLLAPEFSARRMEALRPRVRALVDRLLDDLLAEGPPADLHEAVSFPLPALVICELLGVPVADRDDFRRWSDDAAHRHDEARSRAGLARLWGYMRSLVVAKRDAPGDDVISVLAAADPAGLDQVAMLAAGLLFAGHETTVAAIDRGVVLLLTHPGQWAAVAADPGRVPDAVEEILRCELPIGTPAGGVGGLPRYARSDMVVDGAAVAAGDLVLLGLRTANLDEGHFPDPASFDVTRSPNPHLSFGHGPRFCIGAPLARLELTELFDALVRRCPDLRLAVDPADLRARDEFLTGGLRSLPVTWTAQSQPGRTSPLS